MEEGGRHGKTGRSTTKEPEIWRFHRCAQQGIKGGRGLCRCVQLNAHMCVTRCVHVYKAAKLATCLFLVVVLVFPFIRPSAAQLPLGALCLLPHVCVCMCVCVALVPAGLERLMFLKAHFTFPSTLLYLCSSCFIETAQAGAGSWPESPQSRGGHQRKLLF